jgi:hypothetical protein
VPTFENMKNGYDTVDRTNSQRSEKKKLEGRELE